MSFNIGKKLAGIAAFSLAGLFFSAPASYADPSSQAEQLCSIPATGCSITGPAWMREGTVIQVVVRGAPNTVGELVVTRVELENNQIKSFEPISEPTAFVTNGSGVTAVSIIVPAMGLEGSTGGWAFIGLSDQSSLGVSEAVGEFVPLGSRIPNILGDGYAEQKPVGQPIELQFDGAVANTHFEVEYKNDAGVWEVVTEKSANPSEIADTPDQISSIRYQVPRGLTKGKQYEFRLNNYSDSALSQTWTVIPDNVGVSQARLSQFVPPPVGGSFGVGQWRSEHPATAVKVAGLALGATGVIFSVAVVGVKRRVRDA